MAGFAETTGKSEVYIVGYIVGVRRGRQPHGSGATSWGSRSPRWGEMGLWEALRAQLQASELGVG